MSPGLTATASKQQAQTPSAAVRKIRSISILVASSGINRCLLCPEFPADFLGLLHNAQKISAEDFANIFVLVTFAHQSFGDFGELRAIFQSVGHRCAIEIGAETDIVRADEFHNVVDVLDDSFPTDPRQSSGTLHLRLVQSPSPEHSWVIFSVAATTPSETLS